MSTPGTSDVSKLLAVLRDTPADTQAASDAVLGKIYQYLIAVPPSSDGRVHWFCTRANSTTIDAATFLIRLMAYNSVQVAEWKRRLHECLTHCALCVQGLEVAKVTSQETFLAAFNKPTLDAFFAEFNKWELREIWNDLERSNQSDAVPGIGQPRSVDIPLGTRYRLVTNWTIFQDPRILSFLQKGVLTVASESLADYPVPPGILILLFADNTQLRTWADAQASMSAMISLELFKGAYTEATEVILRVMNTSHAATQAIPSAGSSIMDHLKFAPLPILWSAFNRFLRLIPLEWLRYTTGLPLSLRRTVLEHLRDEGPHLVEVLGCFNILLKRLGSDLWSADAKDDAQVPAAAILENSWFAKLLIPPHSATKNLAWVSEYLMTVRSLAAYEVVLENLVRFFCEDSRQPTFEDIRPIMLERSMRMLQQESERLHADTGPNDRSAIVNVLRRHLTHVVSLAIGDQYNDQVWENARSFARKLLETNLASDVQTFKAVIRGLCRSLGQTKQATKQAVTVDTLPTFSFRDEFWRALFSQAPSANGIAHVICIIAEAAHLDSIKPVVFAQLSGSDQVVEEVNRGIEILQTDFSAWVSSFTEYNTSQNARGILECEGVGKATMLLLLSPLEGFRAAAKSLIGLAFDVDGRMECFRSLLEKYPVESLSGILQFLKTFREYAVAIPEASSLSAALVRCFADILEVLCASPDGLLLNSTFLRVADPAGAAARMPEFWRSLTKALALIYNRAPMWATYVDTPDMVLWMRDALILARDVLKKWRVVERASDQYDNTSTKPRVSDGNETRGRHLVEDLQVFLPELIKWLRLTDEELLHQSFTLLQSVFDLMKETHIRPSKPALEKLQKLIDGAKDPDQAEKKTRLDRGRISQLSNILILFREDKDVSDDEVVIVSPPAPQKELPPSKPLPKPTGDAPRYIQGKAHASKPSTTKSQSTLPYASKRLPVSKFTEEDQRKLDSASNVSSFRRLSSATSSAGPSQMLADPRIPRGKIEPKNEALKQPVKTKDDSDSSESDSDSDGDQEPGTAAFKSIKLESPKIKTSFQRPQVKPWNESEYATYLQNKLSRSKAPLPSTRRRLPPDLSSFHRTLLSWNYNHTGSSPPGRGIPPIHVPDKFDSYDHYFQVFQPLILLECWAQLQQSKEEIRDAYEAKVESRTHVDNWLDVDISISGGIKKEWYLADTDIVLLSQPGHEKCAMAKVNSYVAGRNGIQATLRCFFQSGASDPGLQISTVWQISKVLSLSTLNREYEALQSLRNNPDIEDFILRPSFPKAPDIDSKDLQDTMETYKVNQPQATAILKAIKTEGFTLIQGPPGTGKTSTICGLVTRFLSKRATPITLGNTSKSRRLTSEPATPTARILVCAPSNAAIDELAHRIRDGYIGPQKKSHSIKVVRIGTDQAINTSVKDISLDYLVDQELGGAPSKDISNEIKQLQEEIESIKQQRRNKIAELEKLDNDASRKMTLENEIRVLHSKRQILSTKLDSMKDQQKSDFRTFDTRRRNIRNQILAQADIVCSTLSGAGHDILAALDFDMIIIDEAAQAIELSSLIPLKYRFSRCVMVGDPKQLPPTVLSQESCRYGYNKSLFLRLQQSAQQHVHLLSIQYRMHPDISHLPSQVFYDGKLLDGPDMAEKTRRPWHTHSNFGPYKFYNVQSGLEEQSGHSIRNTAECSVAVSLYEQLRREFPSVDLDFRIGVVSMYKAQVKALRQLFTERFGKTILTTIDFNTVDGFQGQEKDIIILSCVRAGPGLQTVGFLSDVRRMNVALTRARSSLFILGHAPTLERSDGTWAQIVRDARSRNALQPADKFYFSSGVKTVMPSTPIKDTFTPPPVIKVPSTSAALPPMFTPQAMKASVDEKVANAAAAVLAQKETMPDLTSETARGTKRPSEADSTSDSTTKSAKSQLPRKRQKQQTMFIPKKRP